MRVQSRLILIQIITKYLTPFEPDCNALGAKQERERESHALFCDVMSNRFVIIIMHQLWLNGSHFHAFLASSLCLNFKWSSLQLHHHYINQYFTPSSLLRPHLWQWWDLLVVTNWTSRGASGQPRKMQRYWHMYPNMELVTGHWSPRKQVHFWDSFPFWYGSLCFIICRIFQWFALHEYRTQ